MRIIDVGEVKGLRAQQIYKGNSHVFKLQYKNEDLVWKKYLAPQAKQQLIEREVKTLLGVGGNTSPFLIGLHSVITQWMSGELLVTGVLLPLCQCNLADYVNDFWAAETLDEGAGHPPHGDATRKKSVGKFMSLAEQCKRLDLLRDIASGVVHLHDANIIHRDLKPENVLLRQEDGKACISDFETVSFKGSHLLEAPPPWSKTDENCRAAGTQRYTPPEVVHKGYTGWGPASDVWAFGLIAGFVFTGLAPLANLLCPGGVYLYFTTKWDTAGGTCKLPQDHPVSVYADRVAAPIYEQLLKPCLQDRPEDRPKMAQVLAATQELQLRFYPEAAREAQAQLASLQERLETEGALRRAAEERAAAATPALRDVLAVVRLRKRKGPAGGGSGGSGGGEKSVLVLVGAKLSDDNDGAGGGGKRWTPPALSSRQPLRCVQCFTRAERASARVRRR